MKRYRDIKKANKPTDFYFGKPRIEMTGSECLVDGLESVIEYSKTKISISIGSKIIDFYGFDLKINSFTCDGAIVQGEITSITFSKGN